METDLIASLNRINCIVSKTKKNVNMKVFCEK